MAEVHYKDGENGPYAVEVADDQAEEFAREVGGGVGKLPEGAEAPVTVKIEDTTAAAADPAADGGTAPAPAK